mgnify:FL=1
MMAFAISVASALMAVPTPAIHAETISTPTFSLDGANTSSLAASAPTVWRDLIGGTISLPLGANTSRSNDGGGSLQVAAINGSSGAYLAPGATGTPSNIVGDMTLMAWVKPTSWNSDWNIIASRWFTNFAGNGLNGDADYHFAIKSTTSGGSTRQLNLHTANATDKWGSTNFSLNRWYLVGFTISATGNLQFYVNGQPDGSVQTNVIHTARSTNYLFIGDLRTAAACPACSLNGNIGKFRLWNSVLSASQIQADYQNEASVFGNKAGLALTVNSPTTVYRISNSITATISNLVSPAGRITFFENGKTIPGCKNKLVTTTTPSCAWKPSRHGVANISASYTPTDPTYVGDTARAAFVVETRSTKR